MPLYALHKNVYYQDNVLVVGPTGGYPMWRIGRACFAGPQYSSQNFVIGHYVRGDDEANQLIIGADTPTGWGYRAIVMKGGTGGGILFYTTAKTGVLTAGTAVTEPVLAATLSDINDAGTGGGGFTLTVGGFRPGAGGYRSADNSAGVTTTFATGAGQTVTVKNGLITGVA